VGAGRVVEHATKDSADAVIDDARRRYQSGARALRIVRVYGPDGGVRLIDFEAEARNAQRALHEVQLATECKDREVRAATERWEAAIVRALGHGEAEHAVAEAAGISEREVRLIAAPPGHSRDTKRREPRTANEGLDPAAQL